jgi:hypothetical protein
VTNKEVETGSETTISCSITGITRKLDDVIWRKDDSNVKTLSEGDYIVSVGTYESNSQTTTLTVKAAANIDDTTYTCVITSNEWLISEQETNVVLGVFCEYYIF